MDSLKVSPSCTRAVTSPMTSRRSFCRLRIALLVERGERRTSERPASTMVASWRVKRTRSVSLTVEHLVLLAGHGSLLLEGEDHEPAAHQSGDGVVLVEGVLDTGYDISGAITSLVGEGHHKAL